MKTICLSLLLSLTASASVTEGWQQLAANRFEEARTQFAEDVAADPLAEIGWFLTYTGDGATADLEEAALTVLRRDPTSGASEFVLKWMDGYNECLNDWPTRVQEIYGAITDANPELKVFVAENLRLAIRRDAAPPPFEAVARAAGFVTDYRISRRFGAYPLPAFEASWPAEKAAYWADIPPHNSRTGVVLPPREAQGQGVYYALGAFDNPVAQEVTLRLFSYQNVALYVDGRAWGAMKQLESLGPNVVFFTGKLAAGPHEIVVKTSQTGGNNGQFSLQVTAEKNPTLVAPEGARFDLAGPAEGVRRRDVGLAAEIADRHSPLADLVRAFLFLRTKDNEAAITLLEPLAATYPESKILGGALARVYITVLDFLPQDMQLARAYQYLSRLAMKDKDGNLENLLTLALLLNKAQQKKPALELLNGVIDANPGFCDALEARVLFAHQDGLTDVLTQTLALVDQLGEDHVWAQNKLLEEARREGNLERTRAQLETLSRLLPWEGYIAQLNEMDEDYRAAVADLTKRWEVFDDRDFYPFAISKAFAKLGDHAAQRAWLDRTLEVNPGKREALLDLVNLDCYEGKLEDARARLTHYLQLEPADAFFRQRLAHLEGRTAFEAFRVDTDKVIEEAKNKPISAGADSELLLDQMMVRLFPDGSQMRYTHLVTRVLTKKGVDSESELSLNNNLEILELRTIKADGRVFYPADIEHKSSISLSGIGVGDFIDEEHIEYLGPAYYDADGLNAEMTFIFQGVDRIYHHSELVLIYPADLEPAPVLMSTNMPVEPETLERDGLKIVRWLTTEQPPMVEEEAMPFRAYTQPTATFYYNTNWEEIRNFYYNATRDRMGLSQRVREKITAWQRELPDKLELARAVYERVTDRMERDGNFFQNVNLTWETRQGNPTLLLANIYEELGFDVDLVFAAPKEMELYTLDVPQPGYSYALLRLTIDGTTYWADPSLESCAFNYVPITYRGSRGLVINLKELFTTLPEGDDADERTQAVYNLYFKADGSVTALASDKFFGAAAGELTKGYKSLNTPEIKQRIEAGINQDYPGAEVSDVTLTPDLPRGEFEVRTEFSHRNLAQVNDDTLTLAYPINPTKLLEIYGTLPSRKTPVMVRAPHYDVSDFTLMMPEGWAWDVESRKAEEKSRYGSYTLSLERVSDRELRLKRTYHLKRGLVPVADYGAFQAFLKAMVSHEGFDLKAHKQSQL